MHHYAWENGFRRLYDFMRVDMGYYRRMHKIPIGCGDGFRPDKRGQIRRMLGRDSNRSSGDGQRCLPHQSEGCLGSGIGRSHKRRHGRAVHTGPDDDGSLLGRSAAEHKLLFRHRDIFPIFQGPDHREESPGRNHRFRRMRLRRGSFHA